MKLSDFDYELDPSQIALEPVEPRDHSRLLVVRRATDEIEHRRFYELPSLLRENDLLVTNNSRVLPAGLSLTSSGGGKIEILLLRPTPENPLRWKCLPRPGRKIRETPTPLTLSDGSLAHAERHGDDFYLRFSHVDKIEALYDWLHLHGHTPLPHYIHREVKAKDRERYQTVYAKEWGSVAAPTAGLHFTENLLRELAAHRIQRKEVTLHVGYGTFSPIKAEDIQDHVMHEESFLVPADLPPAISDARAKGGRVIAVGTTALRALESLGKYGPTGETRLFISPGYQFQHIDGLITNFHVPKSSLLVLVASLLGLERTKACYQTAIREGYRFYSYGDAMLII